MEHRHHQGDVGQMSTAACIRVVRNEDVALRDASLAELFQYRACCITQSREKKSDSIPLRDQSTFRVGQANCEIKNLIHDSALTRSLCCYEHLISDCDE